MNISRISTKRYTKTEIVDGDLVSPCSDNINQTLEFSVYNDKDQYFKIVLSKKEALRLKNLLDHLVKET